tara:strand:+ start:4061 stop:4549 length:489 start_codon:yes stop_codon:yes gene_type:complete
LKDKKNDMKVTLQMHEQLRQELKHNDTDIILNIRAAEKTTNARFIEVKASVAGLESKMDARFADVDARIDALESKMDARFADVDAKFAQVHARIDALESKMDARFDKMEAMMAKFYAEIAKMNAVNARTLALVEEQRAENRTIWDKQAQLEEKVDQLLERQT